MVVKQGFYHAKCTIETTTGRDLPFIFFVYLFILHFVFAKDKSIFKEPSSSHLLASSVIDKLNLERILAVCSIGSARSGRHHWIPSHRTAFPEKNIYISLPIMRDTNDFFGIYSMGKCHGCTEISLKHHNIYISGWIFRKVLAEIVQKGLILSQKALISNRRNFGLFAPKSMHFTSKDSQSKDLSF